MKPRTQQTKNTVTVKDSYKVIVSETGYDLTALSSMSSKLKPRTIYFHISNEGLNYKVIGQDGKPKNGIILNKDLSPHVLKTEEDVLKSKNKLLKTILQQTAKAGHTKKESVVYIAKEAVPPELNTYLYVAKSKETMETMIKNGIIKNKGVVLVGEGESRTAYFIRNGALVRKKIAEDGQPVLAIPQIKVPKEQELNLSPTDFEGLIGESSDSSQIESTIDSAIKAAGKPAPLPLGKDRYYPRDLFLQKASIGLVAAPSSIDGASYYIGVIQQNSKDKYQLFFDNLSSTTSSLNHPFRVDAIPDTSMTASVVKTEKINLPQGNQRQALLELEAKKFSKLREEAKQKTRIPLEVENKIPPVIEKKDEAKKIADREAREKTRLEAAKNFFALSPEEIALFSTASVKFIKDMQQCNSTIRDLEENTKTSLDFSQSQPKLANWLEKKMRDKKEQLSKLMTTAQEQIAMEMGINLQELQAKKDGEFKEYLLTMHQEAQQVISSDAVIRNSIENAIRDTLYVYHGQDKQSIIDILKNNNLLKDAEDIIFNSRLTAKQLVESVNIILNKLTPEHPYRTALKSILEKNFADGMQHTKKFLVFEKDTFKINESILAESRKLVIATYKENVLIQRRDGTVTLDGIHQKTKEKVATLQQAQKEYLAALEKEQIDFTNITKNGTAISEKEKSTLAEIDKLLEEAKKERKKAASLLDNSEYQYSRISSQQSAWKEALRYYAQIQSSIKELLILRKEFQKQTQELLNATNSEDISAEKSKELVTAMEKIANAAILSCSTKLNTAQKASTQISDVIEKLKIEETQQQIFNLLRETLMEEGQIDYWKNQCIMGGTKIKDKEEKTHTVPTGIGKMFSSIRVLRCKENITHNDIECLLKSCGEEAEDRLSRKSFLGKKIGRRDTTTEMYTLIKDVKNNLDDSKKLEKLLIKLKGSKAYAHYQEQQERKKLFEGMHNNQEIR